MKKIKVNSIYAKAGFLYIALFELSEFLWHWEFQPQKKEEKGKEADIAMVVWTNSKIIFFM